MHIYNKNSSGFINFDEEINIFVKIGDKYLYRFLLKKLDIEDINQVKGNIASLSLGLTDYCNQF